MKYPINNPALFQLIFERCLDDLNLRDDEKTVYNDKEFDDIMALIVLWLIALRSERAIEDVTEDDCKNGISIYPKKYIRNLKGKNKIRSIILHSKFLHTKKIWSIRNK